MDIQKTSIFQNLVPMHEHILSDSSRQPEADIGYLGNIPGVNCTQHRFEFLLAIPKHNLIFFKEYSCISADSVSKTFVVSCWNFLTLNKVSSIKVNDYPPFSYLEVMNCFLSTTGYGSILVYNVLESPSLKLIKSFKAYRNAVHQIINVDGRSWFATYGYDMGSRRKFSIKIWNTGNFKQIARIKVETETEINILYLEAIKCFIVAKDCEMALFSSISREMIDKIVIETYGKKIHKLEYNNEMRLLFVVMELERGEEYKKHEILVWLIDSNGELFQLKMENMTISCKDPIIIWETFSILGFTEKNLITEFKWQVIDGMKIRISENNKKSLEDESRFTRVHSKLLLEIHGKKNVRFWKF